ncbi:MAG: hypothetical protein Q8M54_05260 [Desulfobaccales bacterium]|nr:hypothetical protein [Desulfobaccales bacterium]
MMRRMTKVGRLWQLAPLAMALMLFGLVPAVQAQTVHFKELLPFVDIKIPGWEADQKPTGSTVKHDKMQMSEARASFRSGEMRLEINIIDFLGKPLPFLGMLQQVEIESSEEHIRTTQIQGCQALETFRHQDKQGELSINVADRFWVKIDGEGLNNLEPLRLAAQQLDLKKLAGLAK